MNRLSAWHRRFLLWRNGECEDRDCTEPAQGTPGLPFPEFCSKHADILWVDLCERHAEQKLEREIYVMEQALRRVCPAKDRQEIS